MSLQNLNIVDSTVQWVIILLAKGNHLMVKCVLTLAMKLLSRKMFAGPASMVYSELFLALACRSNPESEGHTQPQRFDSDICDIVYKNLIFICSETLFYSTALPIVHCQLHVST